MKIGVTMFATDQSMDPVGFARAVEERGYHSLYIPEHTHIPTSRLTPAPTGDEVLAEEYRRTVDPFVALGAMAAVTEQILLGTGIALIAQRDPIVTAKEIATLDRISGGRTVLGVGFGWNREEMADHGVDFRTRRDVTREKMLAMQALWANERASFQGEHVRFEESWSWPKPIQQPRPPILMGGGGGPKLFQAIAEYADGWIPIGGAGVARALPELRRAMEERDRDPDTLRIVPFGTVPDEGKLAYYDSIGVTEVALRIPSAPADEVLPILDRYASLVEAAA